MNSEYYTFSQFAPNGILKFKEKEFALSFILDFLTVDTVQEALSGELILPDELIVNAIAKIQEDTERKEQEKKAEDEADKEKQRKRAEKKEQEEAARKTLASELAEMQKKQDLLEQDVKFWEKKATRTEGEISDSIIDEIIASGYIERDEEFEARYSVEKDD